ncbi:hypothetical protein TNCV_3605141 [Trichonephila clavipes]|uniref:Uncharacterized protein n=1 Tax=Trichonephila clavipes TaxID=2585209 RepID=A0A8X6RRA7_TRICX|nr:hypothetical protein TNCV_3605141 [Trichonephila clavipes]
MAESESAVMVTEDNIHSGSTPIYVKSFYSISIKRSKLNCFKKNKSTMESNITISGDLYRQDCLFDDVTSQETAMQKLRTANVLHPKAGISHGFRTSTTVGPPFLPQPTDRTEDHSILYFTVVQLGGAGIVLTT